MGRFRSRLFVVLTGFAAACLVALVSAAAGSVADAARRGDKDAVKQLLESGADVNVATGDGMTALHWVALNGGVDLAKMLLFAGANVRATTRLGGYTPLLMAARNGDDAMIRVLLDGGANPTEANGNGTTALMLAAVSGHADAVATLVERGADVNAREHARGETALMFAAANGRVEAIRLLTAHGADVKTTTRVLDVSAFSKEMADAAGPPAPRSTGTASAVAPGTAPAAPRAGRAGRGANQRGGVDRRYLYNELVSTEGGMTALLLAARQGELESVKALLESGADINQPGAGDHTTPLLIAAINGRFDLAQFLLAHGADPRIAAANGVTPLYAVINCQWAQKALYPQPRAFEQQTSGYLGPDEGVARQGRRSRTFASARRSGTRATTPISLRLTRKAPPFSGARHTRPTWTR